MSSAGRWARRRQPAAGEPLFVYGTLQFPAVLHELLGRTTDLEAATASGRRVAALPERVYPGLVPAPAAVALGFLLHGLTPPEWRVLDAFEDDEYDLCPIPVHAGDRETYAWTYVWTAAVAEKDWSATEFRVARLPSYVEMCASWRRDLVLLTETA
ncbi:gamma-glutamylcyclotransferase family protein [Nocardia sp. NPDC003693]